MKNAKQQSGETGEVASQSAVRQAYSTATVMWDPPPRDYLSYLTHTHTHTDPTHSLCFAVIFYPIIVRAYTVVVLLRNVLYISRRRVSVYPLHDVAFELAEWEFRQPRECI